MDGIIRHYINDVLVEEPMGWMDFEEELDRDYQERIISVKYDSTLTFTAGGYAALRSIYLLGGYCADIRYRAEQECGGVVSIAAQGVIILSDAEWNLTRCEVEVQVVDDALGARVMNNMDIPISPLADLSKNGVAITPVTPFDLLIHRSDSVANYSPARKAFDWWQCMQHGLAYISDGQVSIVSDWVQTLADNEQFALVDGYMLRTGDDAPRRIQWTFKLLFHEMAGRYNLYLAAGRDANGNPQLRLEPESYWYGTAVTTQQLDIQDLIQGIDVDRLYERVQIGCEDSKYNADINATDFVPYVPLLTQVDESFNFQGVCNASSALDIKFKFISETNVIVDTILNQDEGSDEKMFMLQYSVPPLVANAITTIWNTLLFTRGYNPAIINGTILSRYYLPSGVGSNSGPSPGFVGSYTAGVGPNVTLTAVSTTSAWVQLPVTTWTAAVTAFYVFQIDVSADIIANQYYRLGIGANFYFQMRMQMRVQRFDSTNALQETNIYQTEYRFQLGGFIGGTAGIFYSAAFNAGDYFIISTRFETSPTQIELQGVGPESLSPFITGRLDAEVGYALIYSNVGGYVGGLGAPPVVKYMFDRHVDLDTWLSLQSAPQNRISIGHESTELTSGWVLNAKRNVATGECSWEVISND